MNSCWLGLLLVCYLFTHDFHSGHQRTLKIGAQVVNLFYSIIHSVTHQLLLLIAGCWSLRHILNHKKEAHQQNQSGTLVEEFIEALLLSVKYKKSSDTKEKENVQLHTMADYCYCKENPF